MRKSFGLLHLVNVPVNLKTLLSAVAIFSSILTTQASADYVYNIGQNYAPLPNGWILSGQFTTDINTGALTTSDILSWSYTESNGPQSYTFSSTDPGSAWSISGVVIATPSAIEIPSPETTPSPLGLTGVVVLDTGYSGITPPSSSIFWERNGPTGAPPSSDFLSSYLSNNFLLFSDSGPTFALNLPPATPNDPWLIATASPTPEPTTITMLVSGFLAIGGFGLFRRRRRGASESTPQC